MWKFFRRLLLTIMFVSLGYVITKQLVPYVTLEPISSGWNWTAWVLTTAVVTALYGVSTLVDETTFDKKETKEPKSEENG